MDAEALEARVRSPDDRLRTIEDVEQIEYLIVQYAYYLDFGRWDDVVDLFSDNTESFEIGTSGVFLGKSGVERMCQLMKANRVPEAAGIRGDLPGMVLPWSPAAGRTLYRMLLIGQPVIDVDPEGTEALGKWVGLECGARPLQATYIQYWGRGIYENELIKEDSRWRFKNLHWYLTFLTLFEIGWLKTLRKVYHGTHPTIKPDRPSVFDHSYPDPDWCTVPFHYKHPITGT